MTKKIVLVTMQLVTLMTLLSIQTSCAVNRREVRQEERVEQRTEDRMERLRGD